MMLLSILLIICFYDLICSYENEDARYVMVNYHEAMKQDLYLATSPHNEVVITYTDTNMQDKSIPTSSLLRARDYLTHVDGIPILTTSIAEFIQSGSKEVVIPVVDDEFSRNNGHKLVGFVIIQPITPRKISVRRGEILYDQTEGLLDQPPEFLQYIDETSLPDEILKKYSYIIDDDVKRGGGSCLTSKDCNNYNGTCVQNRCNCTNEAYTGTYCQVYNFRKDKEAMNRHQDSIRDFDRLLEEQSQKARNRQSTLV